MYAEDAPDTAGDDYTRRLVTLETLGVRRFLPTQLPYRWHLRRLKLGRVLDVGCGVGRNLHACAQGSVGVDHNPTSVETARARGLSCFTVEDFLASPAFEPGTFDSLLCAHVLEHLTRETGDELLRTYLPYVRPGGRVVLICPQEAGFASDATHIRFVDEVGLRAHADRHGLTVQRQYSFPFVRGLGRRFAYNEFVLVAKV